MMASITIQNSSQYDIIKTILNTNINIKHPYDINPLTMNEYIKIFLNGNWIGVIKMTFGVELYNLLKNYRHNNIIDKFTSILIDYTNKEIRIYYDGGRLIRPLLIVKNNKLNINQDIINDINKESHCNWTQILTIDFKLLYFLLQLQLHYFHFRDAARILSNGGVGTNLLQK
jgi:DNA-directed RNA polymerase beta subunit